MSTIEPPTARAFPAPVRYHYMDQLRALAMLAGIFFHAALAYSPLLSNVWPTADPRNAAVFDAVAWFSHLFRMPLFFLIAGFFAAYLVGKRGLGGFLKNRALRVAVPFVLFLPLVLLSFAALFGWAVENVRNPSPMLGLVAHFASVPDAPRPPPSTTHLWFLYNLCQFYLVYAVLQRIGLLDMRWTRLLTTPWFLVFVLPLLMAPALAILPAPHPAPEQFVPQAWSFGFFGLFFLVGAQVFRRMDVIDELRAWAPWLLVTSLALYAVLYAGFPKSLSLEQAITLGGKVPFSPRQLLKAALETAIAVHMTFVCLVAGKHFLDRPSRINRYIADSSYWIYIIHLPVLWLLQFRLLDTPWSAGVEFAISSLGTLAIGAVTYALLVRHTPIGWLLNGRRKAKRKPPPESRTGPPEVSEG